MLRFLSIDSSQISGNTAHNMSHTCTGKPKIKIVSIYWYWFCHHRQIWTHCDNVYIINTCINKSTKIYKKGIHVLKHIQLYNIKVMCQNLHTVYVSTENPIHLSYSFFSFKFLTQIFVLINIIPFFSTKTNLIKKPLHWIILMLFHLYFI